MSKTRDIIDNNIYERGTNVFKNSKVVDEVNVIENTFIGTNAGDAITTGSFNTFIGTNEGSTLEAPVANVLIGAYGGTTTSAPTSFIGNIGMGMYTFAEATGACEYNIGIGTNALEFGGATDNIAIGTSAGNKVSTGIENVLIGSNSGANISYAKACTAVGHDTLSTNYGDYNTAIGNDALKSNDGGFNNVAVGKSTLVNNGNADYNTAVGSYALFNLYGSSDNYNTAIGNNALKNMVDGTNAFNLVNCTGIGNDSRVSADNQVQLGNTLTTTYVYGTVQDRSDIRDKAEVKDTELGLDFINGLRPVDFKWDYRSDYFTTEEVLIKEAYTEVKTNIDGSERIIEHEAEYDTVEKQIEKDGSKVRNRFHHGFIAQEVGELGLTTTDGFGGYQDHALGGGKEVQSIGYNEFIAPLVKAVQELTARVKELEGK